MTPEQELFWNSLKYTPVTMAREYGDRMLLLRHDADAMHEIMDEAIGIMLRIHMPRHDLARVVKTWLKHYKLPLNPDLLNTLDEFLAVADDWRGIDLKELPLL